MQTTLTPPDSDQDTDPHDAFEIAPGVVLAGRAENPSPSLAPDAASPAIGALLDKPLAAPWTPNAGTPSAGTPHAGTPYVATASTSAPAAEPTFRVTADDHVEIPSANKWTSRIFMTLFAIIGAAAAAAWPHYSDAAKQTIANWIPPFALSSSPPETPQAASRAADGSSQGVAADQASVQSASSDATTPAATTPPSALIPPSTARDLAAMGQQIEALKASVERLKAGQDQMAGQIAQLNARDMTRKLDPAKPQAAKPQAAKLAAPSARPKLAALPPQPIRKPRAEFSAAQTAAILAAPRTAAAPQAAPMQPSSYPVQPAPYNAQAQAINRADGDPVARPPMPLQ